MTTNVQPRDEVQEVRSSSRTVEAERINERRHPPVQFRSTEIAGRLAARAHAGESPGTVARRDLARYYAILDDAMMRIELSALEASLICDALNGIAVDETGHVSSTWRFAWAEIADAIMLNQLDEKWELEDSAGLVARIRDLSRAETLALVDAVERFWREPERKTGEMLREVGLVREGG